MDTIDELIFKLQRDAGTVKSRAEAIGSLRAVINQVSCSSITDKNILHILSNLFSLIQAEKRCYTNIKQASKASSSQRLNQFGLAVRDVLARNLGTIRVKTIRAFVGHLLDVLPTVRDILLTPIVSTYLKAFQQILDYPAHLDHFDHAIWTECVDFCINSIEKYSALSNDESVDLGYSNTSHKVVAVKFEVVLLSSCLHTLLTWKSAQFGATITTDCTVIDRLCQFIESYLEKYVSETGSHVHIVCIIRILLDFANSNRVSHARLLADRTVTNCRRYWDSRTISLRQPLLRCLMLSCSWLSIDKTGDRLQNIDAVRRHMISDLMNRPERQDLTLSDLCLCFADFHQNRMSYHMGTNTTSLRLITSSEQAENAFFSIQVLSYLCAPEIALSLESNGAEQISLTGDTPRKRRRVEQTELRSSIEDLLSAEDSRSWTLGMQIVTLAFQLGLSSYLNSKLVESLMRHLSSVSNVVQDWARVSLASAIHLSASTPRIRQSTSWFQTSVLWSNAMQNVAIPSSSRSACHLASELLATGWVSAAMISPFAAQITRSLAINGPVSCSDAACRFIEKMIEVLVKYNFCSTEQATKSVLLWLELQCSNLKASDVQPGHPQSLSQLLFWLANCETNRTIQANSGSEVAWGFYSYVAESIHTDALVSSILLGKWTFLDECCWSATASRPQISSTWLYAQVREGLDSAIVQEELVVLEQRGNALMNLTQESSQANNELYWEVFWLFILYSRLAFTIQHIDERSNAIIHRMSAYWTANSGQLSIARTETDFIILILQQYLNSVLKVSPFFRHEAIVTESLAVFKVLVALAQEVCSGTLAPSATNGDHGEDFISDGSNTGLNTSNMENPDLFAGTADVLFLAVACIDSLEAKPISESEFVRQFLGKYLKSLTYCRQIWLFWEPLRKHRISLDPSSILDHLVHTSLVDYEQERSEVLLLFVARVLLLTVRHWAIGDYANEEKSVGQKIYEWLIKLVLGARVGSHRVRIGVVHLCRAIYRINTDHGRHEGQSPDVSTRSNLVNCLIDYDLRVAFEAGVASMSIFDSHETSEHLRISEDICNALPNLSGLIEPLKLRAFVIVTLAKSVEASRSLAVHHLVELAQFPELHDLLSSSISALSKFLGHTPISLLRSMERPIIWFWLQNGKFSAFPWFLFGMSNLSEFVQNFEKQLVSQLVCLGYLDQLSNLCEFVEADEQELLQRYAAIISVYSTIRLREGQKFNPQNFLERSLGANLLSKRVEQQDPAHIAFVLLHDTVEAVRTMRKVGCEAIATKADKLLTDLGTEMCTTNRDPLQCSAKGLLHVLGPAENQIAAFRPSTQTRIAQELIPNLSSQNRLEIAQSIRKLGLLLCFGSDLPLQGYLPEMMLRGLSSVLLTSTLRMEAMVRVLMLHILSRYAPTTSVGHGVFFFSIIIILRTLTKSEIPEDQKAILKKLMQTVSSDQTLPFTFDCELLNDQTRLQITDERMPAFLAMVSAATSLQNLGPASYTNDRKRAFLELIAPMVQNVILLSANLVEELELLIGNDYIPTTSIDAELVSRVRGASFLLQTANQISLKYCNYRRPPEQKTIAISQSLSDSLQSFDSHVARCAEATIARILQHCPAEVEFVEDLQNHLDSWCSDPPQSMLNYDSLRAQFQATTDYHEWLKTLVQLLLVCMCGNALFGQLVALTELDPIFSRAILPELVRKGRSSSSSISVKVQSVISYALQKSFRDHVSHEREQIRTCLLILECLRDIEDSPQTVSQESLAIQYDHLDAANAACYHAFHEEAVLLLNKAWLQLQGHKSQRFLMIQSKIYTTLDEPDSRYGLSQDASLLAASRCNAMAEDSLKNLTLYAAIQTATRRSGETASLQLGSRIGSSLTNLGLDVINLEMASSRDQESKYQSSWRLENWDLPYATGEIGPQQALYRVLCTASVAYPKNKKLIAECCRHTFVELIQAPSQMQKKLPVIASLLEMEEILLAHHDTASQIITKPWPKRTQSLRESLQFPEYETVLSARQVVLDLIRKSSGAFHLLEDQLRILVTDHSNLEGQVAYPSALTAAAIAETLCKIQGFEPSTTSTVMIKSMVAEVLWKSEEQFIAVQILRDAIEDSAKHNEVDPLIVATNLLDLGLKSATGRLEKPSVILHRYLLPAIDVLETTKSAKAGALHLKFALFCDQQMESLSSSDDFRRSGQLRNEKLREIEALDSLINGARASDEKRRLLSQKAKATALFDSDDAEYTLLNSSRELYLCKSLQSFLCALAIHDDGDVLISRCSTLWFANSTNAMANKVFGQNVDKVASHKFLILLNQFLARLNTSRDEFQTILASTLSRLVKDHPYQSLYVMYAVQYSRRSGDEAARGRVKAITEIVQTLSAQQGLGQIISNVRSLCSNYVKLATTVLDKKDYPNKAVPFSAVANHRAFLVDFAKLRVPPLTLRLDPRPSCDYSDVPTIITYEKRFALAGGISVPKILKCHVSDGTVCKELVKGGNDDLRQDVVMQQVFTQVSALLQRNRTTSRRNLRIRNYKVLPLATNAGVLEWVSKTVPLQDFLQPLHERFFPEDWAYSVCRKAIADAAKKKRAYRIETFLNVMRNCRPAMKHAFLDIYSDAHRWFATQLAYTRSTAAISIVGYALGLGDRHLHNILIDKSNGEIVHIDLGIAFEQGKTLPIPELVPFRLTRDLVDGMGVLGTEGVFRRCCEFTLEVMRNEQASIKSILDVLKQDPLYSWTLSPVRRLAAQERDADAIAISEKSGLGSNNEIGTEATRALLVVEQKLSTSLSASAVVNELIQEATDPEKLALIFAGWSAWY